MAAAIAKIAGPDMEKECTEIITKYGSVATGSSAITTAGHILHSQIYFPFY